VIQAHVTVAGAEPENAPALWEVMSDGSGVWQAGIAVTVGEEYWYPDTNGTLYRCLQSHTTQSNWTPPQTPSLWAPARVIQKR